MNKNFSTIISILFLLAIGAVLGIYFQKPLTELVSVTPQGYGETKFDYTLKLLENRYVDNIKTDTLLDKIIPELISQLDPHSEYIPAKDLSAITENIEGKFDGVGIVFNMATDTVIVMSVVTGGPGAKAGVQPGDRIMLVNDTVVSGVKMDQMDVVSKLRGTRGTEVKISIERGENPNLIDFTLVRDVIPINSVEADFMTKDSAAYVRINTFAEHTYYDAILAIDNLVKQGATSVIIDLRSNGGGLLDQSLLLANEFLRTGQTIVYVEGEHFPRREQKADGRGAFQTIPLYVVINEFSASASEIFAGAMQDNDRATIIGRRSFGKGLVQEQIPYGDGSALRITIARYYTPLGRPVQKQYTSGDESSYEAELLERFENDEVKTGVNAHIDSTVKYVTQGGRTLYGGGGITPDIFVSVDTTELPQYFVTLYQNNAIFPYAQKYADRYRAEINSIETTENLDAFFAKRSNLYAEFIEYAALTHGVQRPNLENKKAAEKIVTAQLKALIGRYTPLQESAFYYYTAPLDNTIIELTRLIQER
ncbi:MAG: S41 family peptidase [Rikenellaceae bacterium]